MKANTFALTTAALIRDTFREAFARKIFWGLFALSTAMILFFLFIMRIDVVEGAMVAVSVFGNDVREVSAERLVKGTFGGVAAFLYTFGMFLALFASAGLTPSLLEPGRIELLLSKPVGRVHLLLSRYAGNLLVVGANITWLVTGIWLIFGWKTRIWMPEFLLTIATTLFLFAVLLAVVFLLGVTWESAALATMVPVALMIVSPILAQERTMVKLLSSEWSRELWKALHAVLPKVFEIGRITMNVVRERPVESWMPFLSSGLFGAAVLALAVWVFVRRDF
jgi:ABC-type transport system involved in multi-copper enzyme maturation permease subunit